MDTIATLIEATVYDPVNNVSKVIRLTNRNDPRATTANGESWLPILLSAPEVTSSVFDGAFSGVGVNDLSTFRVTLVDGLGDDLALLAWDGAEIRIYAGDMTVLTTFPIISCATGKGADRKGRLELEVRLASRDANLETNLLYLSYAGTGNLEGDAGVKGVLKPWVFGDAKFCRAVLIDEVRQIYQVSGYGPVQDTYKVFEGGQELGAKTQNYTDFNAFRDAEVPLGRWATMNSQGLFKLGSQPLYEITCHVKGDTNVSSIALTKIGDIITRILALTVQVPVQATSVAAFNAAVPQPVNDYFDEQISVKDALARLLLSVGGYYTFNNSGNLILGRVRFGASSFDLSGANDQLPTVMGVNQLVTSSPTWLLRLGAEECHYVHSSSDIVASIADLAQGIADAQETADGKNKVFPPSSTAPVGAISGDQWPDTSTSPATMRRFNGASWVATSNLITAAAQVPYINGASIQDLQPGEAGANVTENRTAQAINGQGPGATATGTAVLNQYVPLGSNVVVLSNFAQGLSQTLHTQVPLPSNLVVGLNLNGSPNWYGDRNVAYGKYSGVLGTDDSIDIYHTPGPWGNQGIASGAGRMLPVSRGDRLYARTLAARHRCRFDLYALIFTSSGALIGSPSWRGGRVQGAEGGKVSNFDLVGGCFNVNDVIGGSDIPAYMILMFRMIGDNEQDPYIFTTEPAMGKVAAGQLELPPYVDGPALPQADQTNQNISAGFFNQGSLATLSALANGSQYLTGFGPFSGLAQLFFGNTNFFESSGGPLATLNNFKTILGTAASIFNQGLFATTNSAAYGSSLLTGFGQLSPLDSLMFGTNFLLESAGTQATLNNFKTILGVASAITNQGFGATAAQNRVDNYKVALGQNSAVNSKFSRELYGWLGTSTTQRGTQYNIDRVVNTTGGFAGVRAVFQAHILTNGANWVDVGDNYADVLVTPSTWGGGSAADMKLYALPVKDGDRVAVAALVGIHRCTAQVFGLVLDANGTLVSAPNWSGGRVGGGSNGDPKNFDRVGGCFTVQGATAAYCLLLVRMRPTNESEPYVFVTECMLAKVQPGQEELPVYSDGPTDPIADQTSQNTALGIFGQGLFATMSSVGRTSGYLTGFGNIAGMSNITFGDGVLLESPGIGASLNAFKTSLGQAASIFGQGGFATISALSLDNQLGGYMANRLAPYSGDANYLSAARMAWAEGDTVQSYKPQEGGANVTENRTAQAFNGQGALATRSSIGWVDSLFTGRPQYLTDVVDRPGFAGEKSLRSDYITHPYESVALSNRWPQEGGANVTENRTSSSFFGQTAWATFTGSTNRVSNINDSGQMVSTAVFQNNVGFLSNYWPQEGGANVTENRTASAISGQSAWATTSSLLVTNVVGQLQHIQTDGAMEASYIYKAGQDTLGNRFPQEANANVTENRTASAINGQGPWATTNKSIAQVASPNGNGFPYPRPLTNGQNPYQYGWAPYANTGTAPTLDAYQELSAFGGPVYIGRRPSGGGAQQVVYYYDVVWYEHRPAALSMSGYGQDFSVRLNATNQDRNQSLQYQTASVIDGRHQVVMADPPAGTRWMRVEVACTFPASSSYQDIVFWAIKLEASAYVTPYSEDSNRVVGGDMTRYYDGNSMNALKPQEANSNITENRTAQAINGQSSWATYFGMTTTVVEQKTQYLQTDGALEATRVYRANYGGLTSYWPQEGGANVTENRTASAISGQSQWATFQTATSVVSRLQTDGYMESSNIYSVSGGGFLSQRWPQEGGANVTENRTAAAFSGQNWGATASESAASNARVGVGENGTVNSRFTRGQYAWNFSATDSLGVTVDRGVNLSNDWSGVRDVGYVHVATNSSYSTDRFVDVAPRGQWSGEPSLTKKYYMPVKQGDRVVSSALLARHRCMGQVYVLVFDKDGTLLQAQSTDGGRYGGGQQGLPSNFDRVVRFADIEHAQSAFACIMIRMLGTGEVDPYLFFTECMIAKIQPGQTTVPDYKDGPSDTLADQTGSNTAASINGQGAFATQNQLNYGNINTFVQYGAIRLEYNITRSDGTTTVSESMVITQMGIAASIQGQGAGATANNLGQLDPGAKNTLDSLAAGGTSSQTAGYDTPLSVGIANGASRGFEGFVYVDGASGGQFGNLSAQIQWRYPGGSWNVLATQSGGSVGPMEPGGASVSGQFQNTSGTSRLVEFKVVAVRQPANAGGNIDGSRSFLRG